MTTTPLAAGPAATCVLDVNHRRQTVTSPPGTSLLTVVRDEFGLIGARFGCGHGMCGACVVLLDGRPVPACTMTIEDVAGRSIVTIEGLAVGDVLHPVQRAFLEEGAMQCGYCTSGMVLAAVALLDETPSPSEEQIRDALAPHLCRCGVYLRVIRAIQRAAR
jgi:aerobic-type carbon monoxide dehydrogenase small subunit (CoxS/CutS family)